jgi:hypothetical protein
MWCYLTCVSSPRSYISCLKYIEVTFQIALIYCYHPLSTSVRLGLTYQTTRCHNLKDHTIRWGCGHQASTYLERMRTPQSWQKPATQPRFKPCTSQIVYINLLGRATSGQYQCVNSPPASLSFNILLALTSTRIWVTPGLVAQTACWIAATRLTSLVAEVIIVLFTVITLLPSHSRFTLTPPLTVTLQTPGS